MIKDQNQRVAEYFDYVAECFPVMCSSDEFHFLPRAETASRYYDRMESLDLKGIQECISTLKDYKREFEILAAREGDREKRVDLELLKANIAGILIELDTKDSFCHNPLLYLKIGFIGLDHALTKPAAEPQERTERASARLEGLCQLLQQGMENICRVPKAYHQAALHMVDDCKDYLREIGGVHFSHSTRGLEKTWCWLDRFGKFLAALSPVPNAELPVAPVEATLRDHFLCPRPLSEVFQIAVAEWQESQQLLMELREKIDPSRSWRALYHGHSPLDLENESTLLLYTQEIDRLGCFFQHHGFSDVAGRSALELCETPTYLRSVRSAASFSAALSTDPREKDLFYITTHLPKQRGAEAGSYLKERLHREYKFLAAHETVPGHHLLDSLRRRLDNPVRRQIESALFYEGWACYAESLLTEYGYVKSPIEWLVDGKRRLWRAARCQIDVGLPSGRLTREDAIKLVTSAGFSVEEAHNQIDRFRLNPGYQLCYTLGRYEIMRLRQAYGPQLGRDRFHSQLLEGGELAFPVIEERLGSADRRMQ